MTRSCSENANVGRSSYGSAPFTNINPSLRPMASARQQPRPIHDHWAVVAAVNRRDLASRKAPCKGGRDWFASSERKTPPVIQTGCRRSAVNFKPTNSTTRLHATSASSATQPSVMAVALPAMNSASVTGMNIGLIYCEHVPPGVVEARLRIRRRGFAREAAARFAVDLDR